MLSENRKYHYLGEFIMHRSHVLYSPVSPKDDEVNWLFLKLNNQRISFVYRIINKESATYENPFLAELSFTMIDQAKEELQLNVAYELFRGEEPIGLVKLTHVI